ncbi:Coenzyme A pyrophosphatase like protein [Aduncisulcus paluster]|uniref:Coenzyme A pyrophosphatase like protein n=1 Tax=Aduncisulcus paluster TaxID=2918883 RepID=A0ABQ5K1P9_9EUKA|nr:Coenzyme A pyrophosphatase like protein [Aduncisulcus paluster]
MNFVEKSFSTIADVATSITPGDLAPVFDPKKSLKRPASVLILMYLKENPISAQIEPHIAFQKRSGQISYPHQMSLPGGSFDEEDVTLCETALRETFEEVGVKAKDIKIVGAGLPVDSSRHIVTPYIGILNRKAVANFRCNADEVDKLIELPISELVSQAKTVDEVLAHPQIEKVSRDVLTRRPYVFEGQGELIWGLSAQIISQTLSHLSASAAALDISSNVTASVCAIPRGPSPISFLDMCLARDLFKSPRSSATSVSSLADAAISSATSSFESSKPSMVSQVSRSSTITVSRRGDVDRKEMKDYKLCTVSSSRENILHALEAADMLEGELLHIV